MDAETYASMPETLRVREVRFPIDEPGCRSSYIIVATTLLDNKSYSAADIADLYHQRWHVELDLRSIKQTLKIEWIHCKTPAMVRKSLMDAPTRLQSGAQSGGAGGVGAHWLRARLASPAPCKPWRRFDGRLFAARPTLMLELQIVLAAVATHRVGDRPNRIEPRLLKRRYDTYAHLRGPRAQARAAIRNDQH